MSSIKLLLVGATGYIGGSILSKLIESDTTLKTSISVIVRGEDKAKTFETLGLNVILFNSLDDHEILQHAGSEHDLVIHAADGYDIGSTKALILGLGDRKRKTGRDVHFIRTTGTSNLCDMPITGKYIEDRIFSDKDDIHAYEKSREALEPYKQRTADVLAVETGLQVGVQTHIIMSPLIYGVGTGLFNKLSIQVPTLMRASIKYGEVNVVGEGKGVWDYVHVSDLANLYVLLVEKIIAGKELPTGKKGILFSATGRFSWFELAQGIANAFFDLKAIKTKEPVSVDLSTASERWGFPEFMVEMALASNSRTKSDVSRELGWVPQKTDDDFKRHFIAEAKLTMDGQGKVWQP